MDMDALLADIEYRGLMTPRMVAVRLAGHPITYGALAERVAEIGEQVDASALLYTALMSLLPYDLRTVSPAEDMRVISGAIAWLGRHVEAEAGAEQIAPVRRLRPAG